jgi:DNA polymerase-3 subunit epsilon
MQNNATDMESLARELEASGDYKILRRLKPRPPTPTPAGYSGKIGIFLDFETTGLDCTHDEIIEVAMVRFRYSINGEIAGISGTFQAFNQPSNPIPAEIVKLTRITDEMVAGHKIDAAALEEFISDTSLVIAHNAAFDRKFAEKSWKFFEQQNWACSATQVNWRAHGFGGAKLDYLLAGAGLFHDAHRGIDDCHAVLEILSRPIPATSTTAFAALLDRADRKTVRIWAQGSPYALKDSLKRRRYRWNDGTDGNPKSWYVDLDEEHRESELGYLRRESYQREVDILCREITARDRFSNRA